MEAPITSKSISNVRTSTVRWYLENFLPVFSLSFSLHFFNELSGTFRSTINIVSPSCIWFSPSPFPVFVHCLYMSLLFRPNDDFHFDSRGLCFSLRCSFTYFSRASFGQSASSITFLFQFFDSDPSDTFSKTVLSYDDSRSLSVLIRLFLMCICVVFQCFVTLVREWIIWKRFFLFLSTKSLRHYRIFTVPWNVVFNLVDLQCIRFLRFSSLLNFSSSSSLNVETFHLLSYPSLVLNWTRFRQSCILC